LLLVFLAALAPRAAGVDARTAQRIDEEVDRIRAEIIKIRRFLHMNPELSNREYETAKLVAAKLSSLGFDVKTGVALTGVVGLLRGGQPGATVACRADMDALPIQELTNVPFKSLNPGVMHACGHDIHTSIALGTAMVLNSLKDRVKGNLKFIFQPAEEGAPADEEGGAALMIREGVLEDPPVSAIFGLHVWPEAVGQALFAPGEIMASSDWFQITIRGRSAHGARPHEGLDAVVIAAEVVTALQTIVSRALDPADPAVLTVGRVEGGVRWNIIPEKVTLEGTVRCLSEANRKKIPQVMESLVKNITAGYGASSSFDYRSLNPAVYNNPELAQTMLPTLVKVLGRDRVSDLKPQMVAEDFAYFGQKIPAFFFFLGVRTPGQPSAPLHSPTFNPDERSVAVGIKVMCHLLLDALEKQSVPVGDGARF
ncbi:MAG: amidohydrolase, partial [Candidatus Aminicenantes bacterium]|nr:amidohydrolase [Candidatus Aminicenantes bacterium]